MIFEYDRQQFPNATVEPRISMLPNLNAAQMPWSHVVRWDLRIWLLNPGGDQPTMKQLIARTQSIFSRNHGNIRLLQPDGSTPSQHVLLDKDTLGGVIVVQPPVFPDARGAEHVTFRTCEVALAATVLVSNPTTLLMNFTEQIVFEGGGPRFGHLEPLTGLPIKQLKKQNTIYKATQSGNAEGVLAFPNVPPPIWPDALVDSPTVTNGGPSRIGDNFVSYLTFWTYRFESASPLIGRPTPWL